MKVEAPVARSVMLVMATLAAGTPSSVAKLDATCAKTAGAATAEAGSSAPPEGAMAKAKASCGFALAQPCAEAAWPGAQGVQAEESGPAKVPSGHGAQEIAPAVDVNVPEGQDTQVLELVAPAAGEAVPGEQRVQTVVPILSA